MNARDAWRAGRWRPLLNAGTTAMRPTMIMACFRWVRLVCKSPQLRGRLFFCGRHSEVVASKRATVSIGTNLVFRRGCAAWFGGRVSIGNGVFFNEGCHIVTFESLIIGDDCLFGEQVSIHDEDHVFGAESALVAPAARGYRTSPIVIGSRVWVGAKATIVGGVTIGDGAVVGAHAVVTRDVPANTLVAGVPARVIKAWHPS